jgi:hypothetical protein
MMRACACHLALLPRLLGAALGVHRVPPNSDSKAVGGSSVLLGVPVLLGDAGVCLDDGIQDERDDDADAALLERIDLPDAMELDELLDQLLRCHRGAGREWKAPRSLPTACLST